MIVENDYVCTCIHTYIHNATYYNVQVPSCQLAIGSLSNIVASGKLIDKELGNNYQVVITDAIKPATPLPYAKPDQHMYIVIQAIGHPISWPKELVIVSDDIHEQVMYHVYIIIFVIIYFNLFVNFLIINIILQTCSRSNNISERPIAPSTQRPRERIQRLSDPLTQDTSPLEQIYNIISRWNDDDCVNPGIDEDVFGQDISSLYICKEDILQFIRMEKIGQGVVVCYMRYLTSFLLNLSYLIYFNNKFPKLYF